MLKHQFSLRVRGKKVIFNSPLRSSRNPLSLLRPRAVIRGEGYSLATSSSPSPPPPAPPSAGEPTLPRCRTSRSPESRSGRGRGAAGAGGPPPSAGGGVERAGVVASPPFSPQVLISGIDRKLQGQLNALGCRVLVRPERFQTAPQSLGGLRRGDLWLALTPKSAEGNRCRWEGAAPRLPRRPPPTLLGLAGKEGLSDSEHSPNPHPLETTKQGGGGIRCGRWAPGDAAREGVPAICWPRGICLRVPRSGRSYSLQPVTLPTPSPNILDALFCAFLLLPQFPHWRLRAVCRVFQFKYVLALHPSGAFPNGAKKEEVLTMANVNREGIYLAYLFVHRSLSDNNRVPPPHLTDKQTEASGVTGQSWMA